MSHDAEIFSLGLVLGLVFGWGLGLVFTFFVLWINDKHKERS